MRSERAVLEVGGLRTTLSLGTGPVDVVRDVSFSLHAGETLALVGESGCGKSMTALSLMRLVPSPVARVAAGEVLLDGRDLMALGEGEMRSVRGDDITMIFQEPLTSLDPVFTVGAQLVESIRAHRSVGKGEAREMAVAALHDVRIPSPQTRMGSYPHELSGGMRQRVMIAMALLLDPKVVIADEPTTALDVTIQAQILRLIEEQQERRGSAMLLITHNLAVVRQIADRVAVMYAGEIVEDAPVEEIFVEPRHPYTQALLRAIPELELRRETLLAIPGEVPDPRALPPACLFAPRCPFALDRCWKDHPRLVPEGGRSLRCWNPQRAAAIESAERHLPSG